jgi:hypothetical protein
MDPRLAGWIGGPTASVLGHLVEVQRSLVRIMEVRQAFDSIDNARRGELDAIGLKVSHDLLNAGHA